MKILSMKKLPNMSKYIRTFKDIYIIYIPKMYQHLF